MLGPAKPAVNALPPASTPASEILAALQNEKMPGAVPNAQFLDGLNRRWSTEGYGALLGSSGLIDSWAAESPKLEWREPRQFGELFASPAYAKISLRMAFRGSNSCRYDLWAFTADEMLVQEYVSGPGGLLRENLPLEKKKRHALVLCLATNPDVAKWTFELVLKTRFYERTVLLRHHREYERSAPRTREMYVWTFDTTPSQGD